MTLVATGLAVTVPGGVRGQDPGSPAPVSGVIARVSPASARWIPETTMTGIQGPVERSRPSAGRTVLLHTAAGAGAGLLIGLVLSSAAVDHDRTTVVLTWTGIGAVAGLISGGISALLDSDS